MSSVSQYGRERFEEVFVGLVAPSSPNTSSGPLTPAVDRPWRLSLWCSFSFVWSGELVDVLEAGASSLLGVLLPPGAGCPSGRALTGNNRGGTAVDSPQLSPFSSKDPLCPASPSFQMSTLSLPGHASPPPHGPASQVGPRLDEDEEGRELWSHKTPVLDLLLLLVNLSYLHLPSLAFYSLLVLVPLVSHPISCHLSSPRPSSIGSFLAARRVAPLELPLGCLPPARSVLLCITALLRLVPYLLPHPRPSSSFLRPSLSRLSLTGSVSSVSPSPFPSFVGQSLRPSLSPRVSSSGCTGICSAYFIAKEILTTERTYLKDLEVITVWFRSAVTKENAMPEGLMTLLFSNIDPIYEFHRGFLKELDQRLALWEGRSNAHVKGDYQRIGDVMLKNMTALKEFTGYLQKHDEVLTELEKASKRVKKLETVYKEFELQKVCYLPLNTFLLKPIQRLMHLKLILERLSRHYPQDHPDHHDCSEALKEVAQIAAQLQSSLIRLENFQKLTELQRDLVGVENLTSPGREFIREGCLYKLTKKGLQQRMFFLFSDMLLYSSKGVTASNQFKVHGQLPLHGMIVDESESEWSVPHCFTIYSAQRTVVVAASSKMEMSKWIEDLNTAINMSKASNDKSDIFFDAGLRDRSNRSSDEVSVEQESEDEMSSSHGSLDKQAHHRANTTLHVCWHRNTSVSMSDHSLAVENQLSGYLLRKFKNSNGWQKLWVVFTNFCLFFYKTHQDDFPLASLPLLGYTVSTPEEADGIHKEYVFKLQFKSHVYFFRAESEYTFERWMEVIRSAAGRMTLLVPRVPAELNRK
ncbi:unnamed protein product [Arctogadus glacialis]